MSEKIQDQIHAQNTKPMKIIKPHEASRQKIDEIEKQIEALKTAFREYGRHQRHCEVESTGNCNCGYRKATGLLLEE